MALVSDSVALRKNEGIPVVGLDIAGCVLVLHARHRAAGG
jgi:hypothetical protein